MKAALERIGDSISAGAKMRIWELTPDANNHLCVQQPDLRFFHDRFDGVRMADEWLTPAYEVLNKSKKVADFTSWQILKSVLVTERAMEEMTVLCDDSVEFLRFDAIKGKMLFAVNVLRVEDVLDREKSEFVAGADIVKRAVFRCDIPETLPPIFKASPPDKSPIYVSESFGRMLVATNLTGARLRDPRKNGLEQIIRGEQLNAFPGL